MNLSAKVALRIANRSVDDLDVVGAFFRKEVKDLSLSLSLLSHVRQHHCTASMYSTKTLGRDGGRWLAHTEDPVYAGRLPKGWDSS